VQINSSFDGGNIGIVDLGTAANPKVRILKDNDSEFLQWFYFRLIDRRGAKIKVDIVNAGDVTYAGGFEDYRAVASYDRETWFRVETTFDGKVMTLHHTLEQDAIYFAYFAPFSMERHADLIASAAESPRVSLEVLGETLDGQAMDLLTIGTPDKERLPCWVIARQHPGETMAEWWMEGFLERMTDPHDPVARALLERCVFYVVPNMNPDGSRRGHLRTNAAGVNLNREWEHPSMERSPEVFLVRERMHQTGMKFCLDVHGDEALPYNFIAGFNGIPSITEPQIALYRDFRTKLAEISPDFQTRFGYPETPPGKASLAMCTSYTAETFGSLSMTLEQPFKDTVDSPDETYGWSPDRCGRLAWSCIDAIYSVVDRL
jgi:murein tripeptide amidase MpaA